MWGFRFSVSWFASALRVGWLKELAVAQYAELVESWTLKSHIICAMKPPKKYWFRKYVLTCETCSWFIEPISIHSKRRNKGPTKETNKKHFEFSYDMWKYFLLPSPSRCTRTLDHIWQHIKCISRNLRHGSNGTKCSWTVDVADVAGCLGYVVRVQSFDWKSGLQALYFCYLQRRGAQWDLFFNTNIFYHPKVITKTDSSRLKKTICRLGWRSTFFSFAQRLN